MNIYSTLVKVSDVYKVTLGIDYFAWTYLQLPLWQWGAGNVYLLVLSSWEVNIAENPIAIMGL